MSYDGTRQLAHSEGEYIYPENARWHRLYFDIDGLDAENRDFFILSGDCSVVHQHVPAEQYTRKAEYFSKGFDISHFRHN